MITGLKTLEITAVQARPLPPTVEEFLRDLGEPALIRVPGRTSERCRLVVTLLHGNEPSGTIGCYRFLKERVIGEGYVPRTDLYFCIANVALALHDPMFSMRQYPKERDLNRCFFQPEGDRPGEIAASILNCIERLKPEAVVDIHNTSGEGPSFSVCTELSRRNLALTALFTHRIVVTDLGLGALIDRSCDQVPVVTVECGGANSEASHQLAYRGIQRIANSRDLFSVLPDKEFDIYHHPVRLELESRTRITFADQNDPASDITLPAHIDKRNFGYVTPDIPLGWVNNPACLKIISGTDGTPALDAYFFVRNGQLHCSHPLKLFMVTTKPEIALSDCLLYAVKEMDHSHLLDQ